MLFVDLLSTVNGCLFYKLFLKNTNADAVNENADGELDDDSDGEVRTDDEDKKVVNNLAFCETDFFSNLIVDFLNRLLEEI